MQSTSNNGKAFDQREDIANSLAQEMGWIESSTFMACKENEEEETLGYTLFGQIMYAVNTFRDIAYVVWAVGWD